MPNEYAVISGCCEKGEHHICGGNSSKGFCECVCHEPFVQYWIKEAKRLQKQVDLMEEILKQRPMPNNPPAGENTGASAITNPPNTAPPSIPDPRFTTNPQPTPPLPHTTQITPVTKLPEAWQDPVRIMKTILALWETDPFAAAEVHRFAQEKLAAKVK